MTDRAALLDQLFDSIDSELKNTEQKWAAESEARIDAYDRGELKSVDGPKALSEFRRMVQK